MVRLPAAVVCALTVLACSGAPEPADVAPAAIARAPAPALIAIATGNVGEVLLEWRLDPAPAFLTGWQYRYQETPYHAEITPDDAAWGAWTNVPYATAATRSHRVTRLAPRYHYFEVRAVAGRLTGAASATADGGPASVGADGIPKMLAGDIIEGGRAWRIQGGSAVVYVPAGTRLIGGRGALSGGRVVSSFGDVATGAVLVVDIGTAEDVGRYPPEPARWRTPLAAWADADADWEAIFDQIIASARLVPAPAASNPGSRSVGHRGKASARAAGQPVAPPPSIVQAPAPELIAVTTGNAGEALLEWHLDPAPAFLSGWQYRHQGATWWTDVPGGAAARSHLLADLRRGSHIVEVRAVAGSFGGKAATVRARTAYMGADGIPSMRGGDIIEGGRAWRLSGGPTVVDVPAGVRLVGLDIALDGSGRVSVRFGDLASGAVLVVDVDRAEELERTPPADADADWEAIFDEIMASARLVPVE